MRIPRSGQCRNNAGFEQNPPRRDQIGARRSCRHGTDMATPLKIPVNDSRPVRQPLAVLWVGLFAVACLVAALLLPPLWAPSIRSDVAESEPALTPENAGAVCIRLSENPTGYLSSEAMQRRSDGGAPVATWRSPPRR